MVTACVDTAELLTCVLTTYCSSIQTLFFFRSTQIVLWRCQNSNCPFEYVLSPALSGSLWYAIVLQDVAGWNNLAREVAFCRWRNVSLPNGMPVRYFNFRETHNLTGLPSRDSDSVSCSGNRSAALFPCFDAEFDFCLLEPRMM